MALSIILLRGSISALTNFALVTGNRKYRFVSRISTGKRPCY